MTDDVKAAVKFDEEVFAVMCSEPLTLLCTSSGTGIATVHGNDRNDRERTARWLADRLNGEEARQAAAVAAAREEQREVDYRATLEAGHAFIRMMSPSEPFGAADFSRFESCAKFTRPPLTATPLADRLDKAEAEREALRAENEELKGWNDERLKEREEAYAALLKAEAQVEAQRRDIHHLVNKALDYATEGKALRAQVATETDLYKASMAEASRAIERLTAQVEAVRALCADFHQGGGLMWPHEVLAAMDGAKP